jgi:replicative DNA helicase
VTENASYAVPTEPAAEVALLGAIVRKGELPADVEALVYPDDFADPHRGAVYQACVDLARKGRPCDIASVVSILDAPTKRAMNNGLQLIEFGELAPVGAEMYHAEIVAQVGEQRRYLTAGLRVVQLAREGAEGLGDQIRQAVDAVPRGGKHSGRPAWQVLAEIIDPEILPPGVMLGLGDLDEHINPLQPGAVTAIGARSGHGKTTFALDVLRRAAYVQGKRALLVSIEQTDREVWTKVLSAESVVDHTKLMNNHPLTAAEEVKVSQAVSRISAGNLFVADVDGLTLADYRMLLREFKPDVSAIDFVGMCSFPKSERRDLAIEEFVYGVKRVSAQEQCHTLLLSQFNRQADARTDKRPHMGDFKDSGGLEHAAHLALLLHRPDLYDPEDRPGEVDVIVGKQRNGIAGQTIRLAAQLRFSRFEQATWRPHQAQAEPTLDYTQPLRSVDNEDD